MTSFIHIGTTFGPLNDDTLFTDESVDNVTKTNIQYGHLVPNSLVWIETDFAANSSAHTIGPHMYTPPQWLFHVLIPALASVLCILGLLGNGIVIFVMARRPQRFSVANIYILNLAAADFLYFTGVPMMTYFNTTRRWLFGSFMCKLIMGVDGLNMFTGIFILAAMAVDRYFAIVHSVLSKTYRTINIARAACVILWVVSITVTLPLWMYANTETYPSRDGNVTVCSINCSKEIEKIFTIYSFITGFLLPLLIILLCYIMILTFLSKRYKRGQNQKKSPMGRVTVMILIAVLSFFFCWSPFWTIRMLLLISPQYEKSKTLQIIYYFTPMLSYLNSCSNPIIYVYFKDDFKEQLRRFCFRRRSFCGCGWNNGSEGTNIPLDTYPNTDYKTNQTDIEDRDESS